MDGGAVRNRIRALLDAELWCNSTAKDASRRALLRFRTAPSSNREK